MSCKFIDSNMLPDILRDVYAKLERDEGRRVPKSFPLQASHGHLLDNLPRIAAPNSPAGKIDAPVANLCPCHCIVLRSKKRQDRAKSCGTDWRRNGREVAAKGE